MSPCYVKKVTINIIIHFIFQGTTYTPAKLPPKPLKLWAYEVGSQHANHAS